MSEFERAKRDVKDEAAKSQVDIDRLHEKLLILDNLSRKNNHELKDKINLILSRFHIHKSRPIFAAALVLKLVCSKEEEAVLDKEQKLMKSFHMTDNSNADYSIVNQHHFSSWAGPVGPYFRQPYVMPPRLPSHAQRRPRPRFSSSQLCFKCNKPGHLVRDCPLTQTSN